MRKTVRVVIAVGNFTRGTIINDQSKTCFSWGVSFSQGKPRPSTANPNLYGSLLTGKSCACYLHSALTLTGQALNFCASCVSEECITTRSTHARTWAKNSPANLWKWYARRKRGISCFRKRRFFAHGKAEPWKWAPICRAPVPVIFFFFFLQFA